MLHLGVECRTVVLTILLSVTFYLFPPALVGIWNGWYRVLLIPAIITSVILLIYSITEEDMYGSTLQVVKIGILVLATVFVALTVPMHADELHDMMDVTEIDNFTEASTLFADIDTNHPRLVDIDLAYSLAQTIIGKGDNLGSIYEVRKDELHIQIVNGHEFWIAPLEFQDIWKWFAKRTSPGFIMVDAEDPFAEAELYTGYNMKYMPSAYFGSNLHRHVYSQGNSKVKLADYTFEVTDELVPYWTVTRTLPTINNDAYIVESVLTIEPESGDDKKYLIGSLPGWIDRYTPEKIAIDYSTWYGEFGDGWWNSRGLIGAIQEDVNVLTTVPQRDSDATKKMYFVFGSNGKPYWFSGLTSPTSSDESLTGVILVDAINPQKAYHIKMSGANEKAALDTINSEYTNFPDRYGTALIPYNVYGVWTYIIPVDSHTDSGNVFQEVGFVEAATKHAVVKGTKEEALEEYKDYLTSKDIKRAITSSSMTKTLTARVERIGDYSLSGKTSYGLLLNNSNAIFSVNPNLFPVVMVTNPSDVVNITYTDTGESLLKVSIFINNNITVRESDEQISMNIQIGNLTEKKETNWERQQELDEEMKKLRGQ